MLRNTKYAISKRESARMERADKVDLSIKYVTIAIGFLCATSLFTLAVLILYLLIKFHH